MMGRMPILTVTPCEEQELCGPPTSTGCESMLTGTARKEGCGPIFKGSLRTDGLVLTWGSRKDGPWTHPRDSPHEDSPWTYPYGESRSR